MFLPDNTPAPSFSLKAEVIRAVRNIYPSADQVLIAGVADMRVVPRLLRGRAKAFIRNAYNDATRQVPPGQNPADHIIILSDWNGALYKAYQAPLTNGQVALVLDNDAKVIAGSYFGAQPAQAALSLLADGRISSDS